MAEVKTEAPVKEAVEAKPVAAPVKVPAEKVVGDQVVFGPDPNSGLANGGTKAQVAELTPLGVNPRLDCRTGDERPKLEHESLPQQVNGPEIGGLATDASLLADTERASVKGDFKVLGSNAAGPHGRG